ncbi:MAG: amidohydrolase family protein [Vicinamibacterales bacterium]
MRYTVLSIAAVLALVHVPTEARQARQGRQAAPAKLALVGGMLLDGYEVPPVHHAAILIEGNRIVWVGRAADATIPPDARVIDTSGRVMMPGLWEMHAHLNLIGHGNYSRWFPWMRENKLTEKVMEISAKQFIDAGITGAVDLGSPVAESLSIKQRIEKGEIPGPRLWISGPMMQLNREIMPGVGKIVTGEDAARTAEALAAAGVDVLKMQEGGFGAEHYKAVVEVARKHKKQTQAHVYFPQAVKAALDAGIDVLQHVGSGGTPPYPPELMKEIVDRGIPVCPTAAHRVAVFPATVAFPERLQDPQLREDFGPQIYDEVQSSFKDWHRLPYFAPLIGIGDTPRQIFFGERGSIEQWITSGAVVVMGTDSGTPTNFNTEALWREIKLFVDYGMSPLKAISASTRISARVMGRGRDLGTIEPGKLADIIVINGNPLFDIQSLAHVEVVVKDGVVLKGAGAGKPVTTSSR